MEPSQDETQSVAEKIYQLLSMPMCCAGRYEQELIHRGQAEACLQRENQNAPMEHYN